MIRGKTINIYLPDGNPKGIKVCDMPNSIVKAIFIPRNKLKESQYHFDNAKVGIYFLLSEREDFDLPKVYIGEAEDLIKRIKQHDTQKEEYWNFAVAFVSSKNNLNKAHAKFLENHCFKIANETEKCSLKNSVIPTKSSITPQDRDFVLDFFDELKILLGTLGYPILDKSNLIKKTGDLFICKGKDAEALGNLTEEGFIVYAQSKSNLKESPSSGTWVGNLRKRLKEEGILKQEGEILVFTKDFEFNSPSAAAAVVLARRANGWTEWKTKQGKTLDKLKRQENNSEEMKRKNVKEE